MNRPKTVSGIGIQIGAKDKTTAPVKVICQYVPRVDESIKKLVLKILRAD